MNQAAKLFSPDKKSPEYFLGLFEKKNKIKMTYNELTILKYIYSQLALLR